jgi:hypothetical protein
MRGHVAQDFQQSLKGRSAILSDRLKLMKEHGLVTRRFYSDHPPRAEYILTDKGRDLGIVIGSLATGPRHIYPEAALVHATAATRYAWATTVHTVMTGCGYLGQTPTEAITDFVYERVGVMGLAARTMPLVSFFPSPGG